MASGDSALARGDTTAAIEAYERATQRDFHNALAHLKAAILMLSRHRQGDLNDPRFARAEEHAKLARRFQDDSPEFIATLAAAVQLPVLPWIQAMLPRAADSAMKHPTPDNAFLIYMASYSREARDGYEAWSRPAVPGSGWPDEDRVYDDGSIARILDAQGGSSNARAEAYLRAALTGSPGLMPAGTSLIVQLVNGRRWEEAIEASRRLVRAVPDSGRIWALLGLSLTRANRWREAQAAFDTALSRMDAKQRDPFDNLGQLLTPPDSARFVHASPAARARTRDIYWRAWQPLDLTDLNEARTEFYARVTNARLLTGESPRMNRRSYSYGLSQQRVADAVRWGPKQAWADTDGRLLWLYPHSRLRALYHWLGGDPDPSLRGNLNEVYRRALMLLPATFDNVPAYYNMDTVDVQVAEFRADTRGTTDVAVFGFVPAGRMSATAPHIELDLKTAAIVKDSAMADVLRVPQDDRFIGGDTAVIQHRTWTMNLKPNGYVLRLEALMPAIDRAGRHQSPLDVRSFDADTLMMSDLVMAGRLTPRDSTPRSWRDFFIEPSSGRLTPTQPLGLLWEVYNLAPDASGIVRYHVDLRVTVKDVERHGLLSIIPGTLGDWLGLSAKGDDAAALGYNRQAIANGNHRYVDYLTLNLTDAPQASYEIEIRITDQVRHTFVADVRHLVVTRTPLIR
ncbi:MAG TPA: hypothetical protein VGI83_05460 [Gemmatimonadales bacterium]